MLLRAARLPQLIRTFTGVWSNHVKSIQCQSIKFYNLPLRNIISLSQDNGKLYHTSQNVCSSFRIFDSMKWYGSTLSRPLLENQQKCLKIPKQNLTKWSLRKGKRKTVKAVIRRFKRLSCGLWIRPRSAYQNKLWKKRFRKIYRHQEHVFITATQATMLDKMVTKYWKKPRYYPDDPYKPYHYREGLVPFSSKPRPAPIHPSALVTDPEKY